MPVRGSRKAFGLQNFSIFVERKKENTSIILLNRIYVRYMMMAREVTSCIER